jgi:hypothetical protein
MPGDLFLQRDVVARARRKDIIKIRLVDVVSSTLRQSSTRVAILLHVIVVAAITSAFTRKVAGTATFILEIIAATGVTGLAIAT